jgi:hypothetical protein
MNRVIRAYDRNITFYVFEKVINFSIPIHTVRGDEFLIECQVDWDRPTDLKYKIIKTPMSLTIEVPEPPSDTLR